MLWCLPVSPHPLNADDDVELERENYRTVIDGKNVDLYAIRNKNGMVVKITNWGAKVQQIIVPDREGAPGDVALGYDFDR